MPSDLFRSELKMLDDISQILLELWLFHLTNSMFPPQSNYCRNPDKSAKAWCYTTSEVRWEYCAVPECASLAAGLSIIRAEVSRTISSAAKVIRSLINLSKKMYITVYIELIFHQIASFSGSPAC